MIILQLHLRLNIKQLKSKTIDGLKQLMNKESQYPVALAQVKACNTSANKPSEIL